MAYWLVKSEPKVYGWDEFEQEKKTSWDGIRNYAARLNLRAMKKKDKCFFYHSNEGLSIVGICEVSKEQYPDPTTKDDRWISVELKALKKLKNPVSLANIKNNPLLEKMTLLKISRLSVQPITEKEWQIVIQMSGE
ncbi:MAG: EVE domain-containing protein [Ferruginibacter sp.]